MNRPDILKLYKYYIQIVGGFLGFSFVIIGTIDLYYPLLPNDERISLAESCFPNDIMRVYTYDLNNATMSDVDTYLIGWRENLGKADVIFVNAPFD